MVKMSLPLKRGNIYHHILNKTTNNCQTFGSSVSCHTAKNLCDKLKDCIKSMYFSMQTVFLYVEDEVTLSRTFMFKEENSSFILTVFHQICLKASKVNGKSCFRIELPAKF